MRVCSAQKTPFQKPILPKHSRRRHYLSFNILQTLFWQHLTSFAGPLFVQSISGHLCTEPVHCVDYMWLAVKVMVPYVFYIYYLLVLFSTPLYRKPEITQKPYPGLCSFSSFIPLHTSFAVILSFSFSLLSYLIKPLHASRSLTHNATQAGRLFELWL